MRIYRGPQSNAAWNLTDSKQPREYLKNWCDTGSITFDGTIDKSGQRHTDLNIAIEEDDVAALLQGLVRRNREMKQEIERLREAHEKIANLAFNHSSRAPSQDALIEAMWTIADYFGSESNRDKPKIKWICWKSI
ncbi:MAG: hypothetical protein HY216_03800 [Candidatus Rokubacteria bacterium]|nr:hypothetical protein [Candidatus Rokubacteria bacterium]